MSTKCTKFSLTLLAALFFSIGCLKAEELGAVIFDYIKPNQNLTTMDILKIYPSYDERVIESVTVYAASKELKDCNITLNVNGKIQTILLMAYKPENYEKFKPTQFLLPINLNLKQKNISSLFFTFSSEVAITKIIVNYKDELISDIEGSSFKTQLDRLEKLSKQNLYAEESRETLDVNVRLLAAKEMAQFPSLRAARILLERVNYDGLVIDYELRWLSLESLRIVIQKLIKTFGEENALVVMEPLYFEDEDNLVSDYVLETMNEFKTSAALFFVIINHTYSPTSKGVWAQGILDDIYKKADFQKYVEKYKNKIIAFFKTGLNFDTNKAPYLWALERACTTIENGPSHGFFSTLLPFADRSRYTYGVAFNCLKALNAILGDPHIDSSLEIQAQLPFLLAIISEGSTNNKDFPHSESYRAMVATALGKVKDQKVISILQNVLKRDDIEESVRSVIIEALK
jgi:HEAT repeat protein